LSEEESLESFSERIEEKLEQVWEKVIRLEERVEILKNEKRRNIWDRLVIAFVSSLFSIMLALLLLRGG